MRVPLTRIAREYRKALVPLGILLAVSIALLVLIVLPLAQRVSSNEERAQAAARAESAALAEFRKAEALREGRARATSDLAMFYKQVLPVDVEAAQRIVQSKPRRLATAHDVHYARAQSDTEDVRESSLERLSSAISLSGSWEDIRAFIYELETAPEFIVIDNVAITEGTDSNSPLSLSVDLSTYYRGRAVRTRTGADGR